MLNQRVYYIKPINYNHNISKNELIQRFMTSTIGYNIIQNSKVKIDYQSFLTDWFNITTPIIIKPKIILSDTDCIEVTKKILYHIQEFFNIYTMNTNTRKKLKIIGNFTRKNKNK